MSEATLTTHSKFLGAWREFLLGPYAVVLTHGSLILLTVAHLAALWYLPFWLILVPAVILTHRIGVLLHEYIHGIPFRPYRHNLWVLSFYDGLFLMFGTLELFRGTHLTHHKWLNTEGDPAFQTAHAERPSNRVLGWLWSLEATQHGIYLLESLRGRRRYVRPKRIALGVALSVIWLLFWLQIGRGDMALKIAALTIYTTMVPVSLRGAIEHHSDPDDPAFSNEYRVLIPLFNLNKHLHHHERPNRPWYLLEFRTPKPLNSWYYFTHWFHAYIKKDYVLMKPMRPGTMKRERTTSPPELPSGRSGKTAAGPSVARSRRCRGRGASPRR